MRLSLRLTETESKTKSKTKSKTETESESETESKTETEFDPSLILHYEIVALSLTPLPCILSKLIDCVRGCA